MRAWLQRSLWDVVPRDHRDSPAALRRRQLVTIAFVVLGGTLLGLSLRIEPGSPWFYPATLGLAVVWTVGAFASGPCTSAGSRVRETSPSGRCSSRSLVGLGLAGLFVAGGLVVREIDRLDEQVRSVLDFADAGVVPLLVLITAVNGVAEELFFRGAAYAAIPRHPGLDDGGLRRRHGGDRQRDAGVRRDPARRRGGPRAPGLRRHPRARSSPT